MTEISLLPTINLTIAGARGPRGLASGPLGAGSVDSETITDDGGEKAAIVSKLGVIPYRGNGASFIDGGTTSGLGLRRDDAQYYFRAPASGTPGQRHALIAADQMHADDEIAYTGYFKLSDASWIQGFSLFSFLVGHNDDPATYKPAMMLHGQSGAYGDNIPAAFMMDNSAEFLCGPTAGIAGLGATAPGWMRNFQKSLLQGGLKVGNSTQAFTTGTDALVEIVGGGIAIGDQASSGAAFRKGGYIGYNTSVAALLIQARDYTGGGTPIDMYLQGSKFVLGIGNLEPATDNTQNIGSGSKRFSTIYAGTGTINTSDATTKTVRGTGTLTDAERDWAKRILPGIKAYQFNDAIAEKGNDGARVHFGVLAQEVEQAGRDAGIADPLSYAFLCRDALFESKVEMRPVERQVMVEKTHTDKAIELVDGKWRLIDKPVTHKVAKMADVPLYDPEGNPLTALKTDPRGPFKTLDPRTGLPKERRPLVVPRTTSVPVMETVDEEHTIEVPVLGAEGQPVWRYGIRYEELIMFLLAASGHG